ncbi:IS3 family transposase [Frankia sp. CNm7]|uniref:IS3 family transposase n=1 Tax=Frankia nepalensis TaxID=1836974 RepID=A0A937R8T2_9ACTN|nr:IS3 family transposase [Frankia nepalensis]MBL7502540.1 IS3 family transposase [Frankia nepalensis]MBL7516511.1 IS3 family transposase [Frankia nepalensis]MBL7516552.1 IS3 family transposase [Frankia nepalensis]MBL7625852.1 IS3 family transposase [Frankia nepalensis]
MGAPRKYPDELRERAIRLVLDARAEPGTSAKGACQRIGSQLGISPETLRVWVSRAEVDAGTRPGVPSEVAERLAQLERENRELRRANEILKSASGFLRGGARPPAPVVLDYIDRHKERFGVEPICAVLRDAGVQIAPSTYYASKKRAPSRRAVTDAETIKEIERVHGENYGVYGVRKVYAQLGREGGVDGRHVARCTVARLMRQAGLRGVSRLRAPRTTVRAKGPDSRPDLVKRRFTASAPHRLWVADITYVRTFSGWVYAAFVLDVFSRRVVGWQLSRNLYKELAIDALNMAIWTRRRAGADLVKLVHHSDRGSQYVSVKYTEALGEVEAVASVGSAGDSYDNAMAEAFNSLFKAELIRNRGPWTGQSDLELAVAEYLDWYNHRRLHGEIGLVPPAEYEAAWAADQTDSHDARQPAGA